MTQLPTVLIAGKMYIVDERLGELRCTTDPTDVESIELWHYWKTGELQAQEVTE